MENMGLLFLALLGAVLSSTFCRESVYCYRGWHHQVRLLPGCNNLTSSVRFWYYSCFLVIFGGIYGLLIGFITLAQIGIMGGSSDISVAKGFLYLAACLQWHSLVYIPPSKQACGRPCCRGVSVWLTETGPVW